jgi:hypothetical protein
MAGDDNIVCTIGLYDYGITPDSTWTEARLNAQGFSIYHIGDEEYVPEPIKAASFEEDYTWRRFASSIAIVLPWEVDGLIDDVERVKVLGESGIQADILRLAWVCGSVVPEWLLAQTDEGLKLVEAQFPRLLERGTLQFLEEFVDAISELDADPQIEKLHSEYTPEADIPDIREIYSAMDEAIELRKQIAVDERNERLAPFKSEIERIANHFDSTSAMRLGITKPSQRAIVVRWLEHYVEEHKQLPEGKHVVSVPFFGGTTSAGTIDFSEFT